MDRNGSGISRRSILGAGGLAAVSAAAATAAAATAPSPAPRVSPPDLSFLRDTPLVNSDRLRHEMRAAGLDAIVACRPANVFYLSNHWPQLDRMGLEAAGILVFPADPARPLALVMHAFLYYYVHTPESAFSDRLVFPYTQPAAAGAPGMPPAAAPARTMAVADEALLTPRDRHRAAMFAATEAPSPDAGWALAAALKSLGLADARLGIDDPALAPLMAARGVAADTAAAEDVIRRARLAKSPAELQLMRLASGANVAAAMAAAGRARALGTSRLLRAEFFAEAARRGNIGHFMIISGSSTEVIDEPLVDGTSVSIDCVSTCRFYHGDFGRTIFVGEPRREVQRATAAIATAWQEIRSRLRPGMRFADIPPIGREAMAKQGLGHLSVSFNPHSVGLFHTDHPQPSLIGARGPDALILQENMILSVDCPLFLAGFGGTIHLEDLMWIRSDGAEALHDVPPPVIIV